MKALIRSSLLLACIAGGIGGVLAAPATTLAASTDPVADADRAAEQLSRLQRGGIETLGDLADASASDVAAIVGARRGATLQKAAKVHIGSRSPHARESRLHWLTLIDPSFVVGPIAKKDEATAARLAQAEQELGALAEAGVASYLAVAGVQEGVLAGVVGKARAKAMIATAKRIVALAGGADGDILTQDASLIDPTYALGSMHAAFVAYPGAAPLPSPHPKPDASRVGIEPNPSPVDDEPVTGGR